MNGGGGLAVLPARAGPEGKVTRARRARAQDRRGKKLAETAARTKRTGRKDRRRGVNGRAGKDRRHNATEEGNLLKKRDKIYFFSRKIRARLHMSKKSSNFAGYLSRCRFRTRVKRRDKGKKEKGKRIAGRNTNTDYAEYTKYSNYCTCGPREDHSRGQDAVHRQRGETAAV